ncbi:MAG: ABC transporter ATP-binding protein [Chloroflexi bacterium]|uniref:ABC transporter ATP-binding protein n=1 Tax=Candidatus Chlorohelix allophototropha TaxID=3003348 RepID=A0A8T7M6Q8_9CHLR|nr:ABC transporter ATP-binding protein [Chloroflexota bacterium]
MHFLKTLLPYLARYKGSLILGLFVLLATAGISLTQPYLMRLAIDSLQQGKFEPILSFIMIGLGLLQLVLGFLQRWSINRNGHQIEADIRSDLFTKTQKLDRSFFDETSIGDLIVNSTSDISVQRNLIVQATISGFNTLFLGSIALTLMFLQNWRLALVGLVFLPFMVIAFAYVTKRMDKHYRAAQDQLGEVSNRAQEVFAGVRVVKAYNREGAESARYTQESQTYLEETMRYARWNNLLIPIISLTIGLTTALVLWVGGHEIEAGRLTIGQFVQFNAYLLLLVPPLTNFGQVLGLAQAASSSMARLQTIFLRQPKISDPPKPETLAEPRNKRGEIEFRNVGFRYQDRWVLRDVSFKVESGKTVAVVGPTGSGKSSLSALVGRVYDPHEGSVLLEGVDVSHLPLETLRREIAYVPQETLLFSLSLRENIAFGKGDAEHNEVLSAARLSRLSQDLPQIPGGFDALVGERGVTLSGGQKQRASIARALLPNSSVIILDDALSSVDARTQNRIAANLKTLTAQGRTTLLITQRLTLVKDSDWIVVLDDGRVVEQGKHAELIENDGLYARMYRREMTLGANNFLDDDALAATLHGTDTADEPPAPALPGKTAADRDRKLREDSKGGKLLKKNVKSEGDEILSVDYTGGRLSRLLQYAFKYKTLLLLATPVIIVGSLLEVVGPLLSKTAIDQYIVPGKLQGYEIILLLFILATVAGFVTRYLRAYLMQKVGQFVVRDLRVQLFKKLLSHSLGFFDRYPAGSLIGRLTSDMDAINDLLGLGAVAIVADVVALLAILITMFLLDWRLALVSLAVMPILFFVSFFFRGVMRRAWRDSRRKYSILVGYLAENYAGMLTVQLFNRQPLNYARFSELNDDYYQSNRYIVYANGIFLPLVAFLSNFASALLILVGGWLFTSGSTVTFGLLVAFLQYTERAFQPIRDLAERYTSFQAASTSSERIFGLMDMPKEVNDPVNPRPLVEDQRTLAQGLELRFEHVLFGYNPEFPVIKDMSFTIKPGEKIAIVGATGAGKTSIVSLLGRNYDIQQGSITIGGVDIREVTQEDLRQYLALVLQDPVLFKGTIAENIRLGNPHLTDAEMRHIAHQVGADAFIDSLPGGYDYALQERGANISAGQRQLLSFARAIAYNPNAILILDEATSSVDTESEAIIQDALRKLLEKRTALIIAHRLSTIRDVDRVIVVERGQIAEMGTQEELIEKRGIYFQLYRNQVELVGQ